MEKEENRPVKKPWPTKDAMEQVYALNLWGGESSSFYSGEGSHNPEIVLPYIKEVTEFLTSFDFPMVVCDLGCGDFNIGKELVNLTLKYEAIDIVTDLIAHNKEVFRAQNLEFHCLDIVDDELPTGDCILLRQVLQHLSNREISAIVEKLKDYKYVILTEHIPHGAFIPNKDIISGQGIRLKHESGVDLKAPPFNFQVKEVKQMLHHVLSNNRGVIATSLYEVY